MQWLCTFLSFMEYFKPHSIIPPEWLLAPLSKSPLLNLAHKNIALSSICFTWTFCCRSINTIPPFKKIKVPKGTMTVRRLRKFGSHSLRDNWPALYLLKGSDWRPSTKTTISFGRGIFEDSDGIGFFFGKGDFGREAYLKKYLWGIGDTDYSCSVTDCNGQGED